MSGRERRRPARILVAISATAETRMDLDTDRYVLDDAPAEIVGLVVEDPTMCAHAGSRLAREIVLSGLERRLDTPALERELRARAAAWRRTLEAEGARLGVRVALETVRTERRIALAQAAGRAETLIVETAALREALEVWFELPPDAPLRTLVLTPGRRAGRDIVAVTGASDSADAVLAAAVRLARRSGAHLTVLDIGAARNAARTTLARRLAALGLRPSEWSALEARQVDARTIAAHAAHASLLVLSAAARRDAALIEELAGLIRGALMLVRGKERLEGDASA